MRAPLLTVPESTIALGWDKGNTGTKGNPAKTPDSLSILTTSIHTTPIAFLPHSTRYHADNQSYSFATNAQTPSYAVKIASARCCCPRSSAPLSSMVVAFVLVDRRGLLFSSIAVILCSRSWPERFCPLSFVLVDRQHRNRRYS